MKAELREDEYVHITPENLSESLVLKNLFPDSSSEGTCSACNQPKEMRVVIHWKMDRASCKWWYTDNQNPGFADVCRECDGLSFFLRDHLGARKCHGCDGEINYVR